MRTLSYRTKQRIRKSGKLLLILLAALAVLMILAVIYMERFVVYSPDGAYLDFGRSTYRDMELSQSPSDVTSELPEVRIDYADSNVAPEDDEVTAGYYIDLEMMQDPAAVLKALKELDGPCTVLMDLKGGNGSFYYSCDIEGAPRADIDIDKADDVITYLKGHGFTMAARVKTLQDSAFALDHISSGLMTNQAALWVGNGFYWLDPSDSTVASYLKQIARDLAGKGFKEIVFDDFRFPEGSQIVYESSKNKTRLMEDLATELLNFFSSSSITISFGNPAPDFAAALPSRVFIANVTGSGVKTTAGSFTNLEDPEKQLIFLTGSKDSRFESFQLLRPLITKGIG